MDKSFRKITKESLDAVKINIPVGENKMGGLENKTTNLSITNGSNFSTTVLTFAILKPFLIGALIAAIALLSMTILSFFAKLKLIIAISILTIILLLVVKGIYLIP